MKKLLVLMIILGMASMANAAMSWDLTFDSTTVYATVTDNEGSMYLALAIVPADGTLSSFAAGDDMPADGASWGTLADVGLSALGQGELWAMADTGSTPVYNDGDWLKASWALDSPATSVVVSLYEAQEDLSYELLDTLLIPEPATVALLALGGLLLRRRK